MPKGGYELSERADETLARIFEYSTVEFGLRTARRYLTSLHEMFQLLAESPNIGAEAAGFASNVRRLEHRSHVVYYRPVDDGVPILDVLHRAEDPAPQL